jgi:hypothetical protein
VKHPARRVPKVPPVWPGAPARPAALLKNALGVLPTEEGAVGWVEG